MSRLNFSWIALKFITIVPPVIVLIYLGFWGYRLLVYRDLSTSCDFAHYWAASHLAAAGEPAAVYDFSRLQAAEQAALGTQAGIPWFNTPIFLLFILPLSLFPYLVSLALWLLTTGGGYLYITRRIAPYPLTPWLTLAFPGTFLNATYGQNGFLSAIFLGGGLLLLDRFPIAAGVLLGLLTYKPQLALLIPLVLLASRRWRALAAMLGTTLGLILASALVFGFQVWAVFLEKILFLGGALQTGKITTAATIPLAKMLSVYAALRLLGAGSILAAGLQILVTLVITATVVWVWYRGAPLAIGALVLVTGIFLVTPYAFIYDIAILALPLAWLGWQGYTTGWQPGEPLWLFLGWIAPLFMGLYWAPLSLLPIFLLFLAGLRRWKIEPLKS
jgi:hypothetical protein